MKNRTIIFLCMMSFCSTLVWGQTWNLSATMTAVLDNNVLTISTTLDAEAIPESKDFISSWHDDHRDDIHSVVIEDGVTSVSSWLFAHHAYLTSVTMANTVSVIGGWAFYNCGSLPMITIPEGVTTLQHAAFKLCGSLKEVYIPASVTSIEGEMFVECSQLETIHVHADNLVYSSDEGVLYDKDQTTLIIYPEGKSDATFEIPSTVEQIYANAFYNSRIETITISNSITRIGQGAFLSSNHLTTILIPASVEEIEAGAFASCANLTSISVDAGNKSYTSDGGILYNFDKTLLHSYPAGISGDFTVPSFVLTIGAHAFSSCDLLTSVTMPNTVTSMGEAVFIDCSNLKSVTLSNELTEIPGWAFSKCYNLASITIPRSVIELGQAAFEACTGLTEVTVEWETPLEVSFDNNVFYEVNTPDVTLFVPAGTKHLYQDAEVWMYFGIEEYEFSGNEKIEAATLKAYASNGILCITGLTPGTPLYIYNITGQLLYSGMAKAEETQLPIAWRGVCVVVAGAQCVKVNGL